jgi:hypothetical protein
LLAESVTDDHAGQLAAVNSLRAGLQLPPLALLGPNIYGCSGNDGADFSIIPHAQITNSLVTAGLNDVKVSCGSAIEEGLSLFYVLDDGVQRSIAALVSLAPVIE